MNLAGKVSKMPQVDFVREEIMLPTFSNKLAPQTDPKLHPETAKMEFEQSYHKAICNLEGWFEVHPETQVAQMIF